VKNILLISKKHDAQIPNSESTYKNVWSDDILWRSKHVALN